MYLNNGKEMAKMNIKEFNQTVVKRIAKMDMNVYE